MSRGQYVIYERTLKDGERLFLQTAREVIEEIEELDRKPRTHPSRAVTEIIFTGGGGHTEREGGESEGHSIQHRAALKVQNKARDRDAGLSLQI